MLGWPKSSFGFKFKKIFHFHEELYWTTYSWTKRILGANPIYSQVDSGHRFVTTTTTTTITTATTKANNCLTLTTDELQSGGCNESDMTEGLSTPTHRLATLLSIILSPGCPTMLAKSPMEISQGGVGSIPGSGRSPGKGNSNPRQCSCLENSMDIGSWRATVHGVAKSWTQVSMNAYT